VENITDVAGGDVKWHGTKMEFAYGFDVEMASKMDIMISVWHANNRMQLLVNGSGRLMVEMENR
jgi:hypothetical protein